MIGQWPPIPLGIRCWRSRCETEGREPASLSSRREAVNDPWPCKGQQWRCCSCGHGATVLGMSSRLFFLITDDHFHLAVVHLLLLVPCLPSCVVLLVHAGQCTRFLYYPILLWAGNRRDHRAHTRRVDLSGFTTRPSDGCLSLSILLSFTGTANAQRCHVQTRSRSPVTLLSTLLFCQLQALETGTCTPHRDRAACVGRKLPRRLRDRITPLIPSSFDQAIRGWGPSVLVTLVDVATVLSPGPSATFPSHPYDLASYPPARASRSCQHFPVGKVWGIVLSRPPRHITPTPGNA